MSLCCMNCGEEILHFAISGKCPECWHVEITASINRTTAGELNQHIEKLGDIIREDDKPSA